MIEGSMALTRQTRGFAFVAFVAALVLAALCACAKDSEDGAGAGFDAGPDRATATPQLVPDAAPSEASTAVDAATDAGPDADAASFDAGPCNVRIDAIPVADSPHVADGTPVVYSSNPPSSGPHYNAWANFQEFNHIVDDRNLVHSLEHGAVLLLYACQGVACDAIVPALRAVRTGIADDPMCDPAIRTRVILAPRAANDVAVAAAAWGYIYRADCVDPVSLTAFINDHYAKGPENFCVAGQIF